MRKGKIMKAVRSRQERDTLILNLYVKLSKLNHKIRKEQNLFKKLKFKNQRHAILGEIRQYEVYTWCRYLFFFHFFPEKTGDGWWGRHYSFRVFEVPFVSLQIKRNLNTKFLEYPGKDTLFPVWDRTIFKKCQL